MQLFNLKKKFNLVISKKKNNIYTFDVNKSIQFGY